MTQKQLNKLKECSNKCGFDTIEELDAVNTPEGSGDNFAKGGHFDGSNLKYTNLHPSYIPSDVYDTIKSDKNFATRMAMFSSLINK